MLFLTEWPLWAAFIYTTNQAADQSTEEGAESQIDFVPLLKPLRFISNSFAANYPKAIGYKNTKRKIVQLFLSERAGGKNTKVFSK